MTTGEYVTKTTKETTFCINSWWNNYQNVFKCKQTADIIYQNVFKCIYMMKLSKLRIDFKKVRIQILMITSWKHSLVIKNINYNWFLKNVNYTCYVIFASIFLQSNEEILDEIKKKNHKIENVLKHRRNKEGKYSISQDKEH